MLKIVHLLTKKKIQNSSLVILLSWKWHSRAETLKKKLEYIEDDDVIGSQHIAVDVNGFQSHSTFEKGLRQRRPNNVGCPGKCIKRSIVWVRLFCTFCTVKVKYTFAFNKRWRCRLMSISLIGKTSTKRKN